MEEKVNNNITNKKDEKMTEKSLGTSNVDLYKKIFK